MAATSQAQALIAAMITPALLILTSASLIATALVRLARIVDRVRKLAEAGEGEIDRATLARSERRANLALLAVTLFFAAAISVVVAGVAIAIDRASGDTLPWLPISFTLMGMGLIVAGGAAMLAESADSARQIHAEIAALRARAPSER